VLAEGLIRRAAICVAVAGLIVLGLAAPSSAAETTASLTKWTFKAIPIPREGGTWPNTGNCRGCGAALELEYELEGSGYGVTAQNPKGGIPPVSQISLALPAGLTLHPAGFGTCSEETLKRIGPSGCPTSSSAGPVGNVLAEVTFGTERVPEETEVRPFFGPGGTILFFIAGHSPVSLEIISVGHYEKSSAPYGEELIAPLPAVATVPGAPLVSFKAVHIKLGAARMQGEAQISYVAMPTECEVGGLPYKTEVFFGGMFGGEREFGITPKLVTATYRAPCPVSHEETQKEKEEREQELREEETANKHHEEEAAAKRREEEEATAKKHHEEEAVAAKRRQEEETAANKHHEEETAANKHHEEEAAKHGVLASKETSVGIGKVKVMANSLVISIKTSQPGTVTISGPGLKRTVKSVVAGTNRVIVALTKAGKAARKAGKKIKLVIILKAGSKTASSSAKIKL
jgi:hypothetical protein